MRVLLRNPKREVEVAGPLSVRALLERLEINPEGVLVIRGDTLAVKDEQLADDDVVEIRPVSSGGALGASGPPGSPPELLVPVGWSERGNRP